MIDINNITPIGHTSVNPSDQIFQELGNNTYDYKDLLSELIDNCVAARVPNELLHVTIDLLVDSAGVAREFIITDHASGISQERLGLAVTPAGIRSSNSLNEHGLGMKQAVAALGKLKYLATKTRGEQSGRLIKEFRFGEIETFGVIFPQESGTIIAITELRAIVNANPTNVTRTIRPYLGARYRRFLKPDNPQLELRISIRSYENPDRVQYEWRIEQVKPIYFHPSTRENRPVIQSYGLSGNGWTAELTFGYAPQNEAEYEELGLDKPTKFEPYSVSIAHQGLDVILHDRVILFHQLSELGIVTQRHSDYNEIRGEINLLNGFSTAITKNSIIQDQPFNECIEKIKFILRGDQPGPGNRKENYITKKSYPEEIPEVLLRDRLIEWLQNNPLNKRVNIHKEYAVEGIEGFVDILADGEAWEVKVDQASAFDVYQLFMYMDIQNLQKGFLVAKNFTPGAEIAKKHIEGKHGKEIILAPRNQFPINHPPSDSEREEYY